LNNQNQKNAQVQNGLVPTNISGSTANNARAIADNGTIMLQFQNPTDIDIVNRLEKIETIIQKYIMRNDVNSTTKSIEESNNRIINELSEVKSSISGSFPSNLFSGIISGALVAAIVSAMAFFVLLRVYSNGRIKLSELKLRRRNNSNYT
jgi:predicted PurR-regulated permease PerM